MSRARFEVAGRFDGAIGATVVIDREAGTISVRPKRRRTVYTLPLATAAAFVVFQVTKADLAAKRKGKPRRVSRRPP